MNKLILNCLPVISTKWASPSMSILKAFMMHNGYHAYVYYWNVAFEYLYMDFFRTHQYIEEDNPLRILYFFNYIASQQQDMETLKTIK